MPVFSSPFLLSLRLRMYASYDYRRALSSCQTIRRTIATEGIKHDDALVCESVPMNEHTIAKALPTVLILLTGSLSFVRCQCESNWFGANCSEVSLCNYNGTSLCPTGFACKITGGNQECKWHVLISI